MNKIKHIPLLLCTLAVMVLFFSCKKTPDMPPVKSLANVVTIKDLRNLYAGSNIHFTQDISLFATVTMTDNYKTLFIRDNTGSIALKQLTAHGIYEGDSLRINLNGSWLDLTGTLGSLQIDSVDVSPTITNKVVKLAVGKVHNPVVVSIPQLDQSVSSTIYSNNTVLPLSIYDGELVQINDVQFSYADSGLFFPLVPTSVYANHNIYDCGAINTLTLSLYTGTADFVNQKVPHTKSGSMIGAIAFYNGALQITPRSFADINFTQNRCGVDTLTQNFSTCNSGVTSAANFASALPGWSNLPQIGNLIWSGNGATPASSYVYATNQYSSTQKNAMWLITPPIQNNNPNKNVNFQFSFSTTTSTTRPRQLSVWVSTNFNGYNLNGPNAATWTEITSAFSSLATWGPYSTGSIPFVSASANPVMISNVINSISPGYTGTYYIGFKYVANSITTDSTMSFAIDNFALLNN
ncbi:MAG TPA: DUF5689 domain-containing protein [Bacteroidia bacterium]|nr:DUF5689 domain-containing protein [Bacteroidia bacterium]